MKHHSPTNPIMPARVPPGARRWMSAAWLVMIAAFATFAGAPARAADGPKLEAIDVQPLPGQQLQLTMRLSGPAHTPL